MDGLAATWWQLLATWQNSFCIFWTRIQPAVTRGLWSRTLLERRCSTSGLSPRAGWRTELGYGHSRSHMVNVIGHEGDTYDFLSSQGYIPSLKAGYSIASNVDNDRPMETMACYLHQISQEVLGGSFASLGCFLPSQEPASGFRCLCLSCEAKLDIAFFRVHMLCTCMLLYVHVCLDSWAEHRMLRTQVPSIFSTGISAKSCFRRFRLIACVLR